MIIRLFYYIACGLLCPIYFPLKHPWPICFPSASSALFIILRFHGLLLTSLNFPDLGSWAIHQHFTFFTCITSGLLWPIFTFLHHILPMGLLLLSLRAPLSPFAFSMLVCIFYGPRSVILAT